MRLGLENFAAEPPPELRDARIGVLMNRASVDRQLRFACDLINDAFPRQLTAIFSPQHGLWGDAQANMIESGHDHHEQLGVPIYSLYSETRRPTERMLRDIDCLVVDLQDVGTRVYTFVWTLLECMRACAANEVSVHVLDRPNPIGGEIVEGPPLRPGFESFVGGASIPMRHALTIGELATYFNEELEVGANLSITEMTGWNRKDLWSDFGRAWIPPSPNLPTFESTLVYPGQVLLEGTNLSEGRGTTIPFQVVGAPFFDSDRLLSALQATELEGVTFLPIRFRPTFDKWSGQVCEGLSLQVTDATVFRPYATSVEIISQVARLYPNDFRWIDPPYEYETKLPPIDIISGSDALRTSLWS